MLPKNQGRMLPYWLDTGDPEAQRGSTRVRSVDRNLIVGRDRRRGVFQVWGPSLSAGGWLPICDCQDDRGRPFRGTVPWELVVAALVQARGGELSADVAARHNEALDRAKDAELERQVEAGAKYYARAVAGEREGWGRWDYRDVEDAYRMAQEGGSKAAPRGVRYFGAGLAAGE
jgi:hypothetical protein